MSDLADLLERFRRGPEVLAVILTGVYGEEIDFTSAPGKWSIRQIMAHLADSEIVGTWRMRLVIAEDQPVLQAYDQDKWSARLDYDRRKPTGSLDTFRRTRSENHELLKGLPEESFSRTGLHTERGAMTLRQIVETYAQHAESHAMQIQGIREEYKKAKRSKG